MPRLMNEHGDELSKTVKGDDTHAFAQTMVTNAVNWNSMHALTPKRRTNTGAMVAAHTTFEPYVMPSATVPEIEPPVSF